MIAAWVAKMPTRPVRRRNEEFRPLTESESELLQRLLSAEITGREEMRNQLRSAQVRTIDENGSFEIRSTETRLAPVVNRIPVEAEGSDSDGLPVYTLLHVMDGKAIELELYKADGSRIRSCPRPDAMNLFAPPTRRRMPET